MYTKLLSRILPGHVQAKDVAYGNAAGMKLDVYGKPAPELKPVVLFWHGGSWKSGSKDQYQFIADYLEKLGAIAVIVGYPLYPQQRFPGFINDAQAAVQWAHKYVSAYGGDPDRIYVMGHSAGAHTAVTVTLQDTDNYIQGCISFAAPMTLLRRYWEGVFGKDTFDSGKHSPINHIDANNHHRFLLVHGMTDQIVYYRDSRKLYNALKDVGYPVEFIRLRFIGHFRILLTMVRPFAYRYNVGKRIKTFISQ